jgi:hypothetical protein
MLQFLTCSTLEYRHIVCHRQLSRDDCPVRAKSRHVKEEEVKKIRILITTQPYYTFVNFSHS